MNALPDLPSLDQQSDDQQPFNLPDLGMLETAAPDAPSAPEDSSVHRAVASNFANPMDLHRYTIARMNGASEADALKVGDNGVGKWGDDTTSFKVPMVALPTNTPGLAHNRLVKVWTEDGKSVIARLADTGAPNGRIDLNPASAVAIGNTNGLKPVQWQYASGIGDVGQTPNLSSPQSISLGPSLADLKQGSDLASADVPIPQELGVIGEQPDEETDTSDMQMDTDSEGLPSGISFSKSGISYKDTGHPIEMPPPDSNTRVVSRNPNGSITYSNGVTRWPQSGDFIMDYGNGNRFLQRFGDNKAIQLKTPEAKADKVDSKTYDELSKYNLPVVDGETNAKARERVYKYLQEHPEEKEPSKFQQSELKAIPPLLNVRNLATKQFLQTYPNYKSLIDIANTPREDRTGAMDARAIAAYSQIESPGYQPAQKMVDMIHNALGIKGKAQVTAERLEAMLSRDPHDATTKGTRLLTDDLVDQLAEQARQATKPRAEEYLKGVDPIIKRAKKAGIYDQVVSEGLVRDATELVNPDQLLGGQSPASTPKPIPTADEAIAAQKLRVQQNPSDTKAKEKLDAMLKLMEQPQ